MAHDYELAAHALATKPGKKSAAKKHLKEFHAKELHSGGFTVHKHSGKPGEAPTEHAAPHMAALHAMMEEHMGKPNAGEDESNSPAPEPQPEPEPESAPAPQGV